MRVEFTPTVRGYFDRPETVLYEKGYFSYPEGSKRYTDKLVRSIMVGLPTKRHKPAPPNLYGHGGDLYYAAFRHNRQTVWYAFFTRHTDADGETVFIVRFITNNHTIAHLL